MNDKEKLRHQLIMAKSLVKSNNKKIKKALELFYAYDKADLISKVLDKNYNDSSNEMRNLIEDIKKTLEE